MSSDTGLFATAIFLSCLLQSLAAPDLQFDFGQVRGVDKLAEGSRSPYYAYYGIPFAQPPVGDLRLKAPTRYRGTGPNTVITSDTIRTACYQPVFTPDYVMSEDCLYLNVYVPTTSSQNALKKVMVFIYGGGFFLGDTYIYTPSRLVTEGDVIVVTTNYRLGVFGFLSSGEGDGNYGLLDQVAALEWVRENIGTFGGDPTDVTLFGESAGGISASLLSISPKTKGMFSKVIIQSGTALTPGILKVDPGPQFDKLAKATGCVPWFYSSWLRSRFLDSINSCLRGLGTEALQGAALSLQQSWGQQTYAQSYRTDNEAFFSPTVDGDFLPKNPNVLMNDKSYLREIGTLDRSFIVGFTNNEGLLFAEIFLGSGGNLTSINTLDNAEEHLDDVLNDKFTLGVPEEFRSVATYEYLYPRPGGQPPLQGVLDITGDYGFVVPSIKFARALIAADKQTKVFMYLFDHSPRVSDPSLGIKGSSHAMELAYLFDADPWLSHYNYYTTVPDPSGSDSALFGVIQGAWTQFAKTGSPSGYLAPQSSPWPQYDRKDESYLAISTRPEVRQHVYAKRVALWTELFMPRRN